MNDDLEQRVKILEGLVLSLFSTDKLTIRRNIKMFDASNFEFGAGTGTKIGTSTSDKIAFWNATPDSQVSPSNSTSVANGGAGTTIKVDTTFTGGVGSTAFTVTDIVEILKKIGIAKN